MSTSDWSGLFVIIFALSGSFSFVRSNRFSFSFPLAIPALSPIHQMIVTDLPPVLEFSSLSVRHSRLTPTVVLNHLPVVPLNRIALVVLSYTFEDMNKVGSHTLSKTFWSRWRHGRGLDVEEFLTQNCYVEYLLYSTSSCSENRLFFIDGLFFLRWSLSMSIFESTYLGWDWWLLPWPYSLG